MDNSLTLASLEIGRALLNRGQTVFRVHGYCMFPGLRPGDLLYLKPCTVSQVKLNDIAVCRRADKLFGHRTIAKKIIRNRPTLITRPDSTGQGQDEPVFDKDLLGVVTGVQRRGRCLPPPPLRPNYRLPHLIAAKVHAHIQAMTLWSLHHGLHTGVNSIVARCLHSHFHKAFLVHIPLQTCQSHDLYQPVTPENFTFKSSCNPEQSLNRFVLTLYINKGKRPAARAFFVRAEDNSEKNQWQLHDLQVRLRYHGFGLENDLRQRVAQICNRNDVVLHWLEQQ